MRNFKWITIIAAILSLIVPFYAWALNEEKSSLSPEVSYYFPLTRDTKKSEGIFKLEGTVIVPEDVLEELRDELYREQEESAPVIEKTEEDTKVTKKKDEAIDADKKYKSKYAKTGLLEKQDEYEQIFDFAYVAQLSTLGDHMQDAVSESLQFDELTEPWDIGSFSLAKSVSSDALFVKMTSDTGLSLTTISFLIEKGYLDPLDAASDALIDIKLTESFMIAKKERSAATASDEEKSRKEKSEIGMDKYEEVIKRFRSVVEEKREQASEAGEDISKELSQAKRDREYSSRATELGILDDRVEDMASLYIQEEDKNRFSWETNPSFSLNNSINSKRLMNNMVSPEETSPTTTTEETPIQKNLNFASYASELLSNTMLVKLFFVVEHIDGISPYLIEVKPATQTQEVSERPQAGTSVNNIDTINAGGEAQNSAQMTPEQVREQMQQEIEKQTKAALTSVIEKSMEASKPMRDKIIATLEEKQAALEEAVKQGKITQKVADQIREKAVQTIQEKVQAHTEVVQQRVQEVKQQIQEKIREVAVTKIQERVQETCQQKREAMTQSAQEKINNFLQQKREAAMQSIQEKVQSLPEQIREIAIRNAQEKVDTAIQQARETLMQSAQEKIQDAIQQASDDYLQKVLATQ